MGPCGDFVHCAQTSRTDAVDGLNPHSGDERNIVMIFKSKFLYFAGLIMRKLFKQVEKKKEKKNKNNKARTEKNDERGEIQYEERTQVALQL